MQLHVFDFLGLIGSFKEKGVINVGFCDPIIQQLSCMASVAIEIKMNKYVEGQLLACCYLSNFSFSLAYCPCTTVSPYSIDMPVYIHK